MAKPKLDVLEAFVLAVRDLARDRTPGALLDELADRDVPEHLRGKIDAVARGDRRRAWHLAADVLPGLGSGRSTVDDVLATAGLFDALEDPEPPTLLSDVRFPAGTLIVSDDDGQQIARPDTTLTPGRQYVVAVEPAVVGEVMNLMRG